MPLCACTVNKCKDRLAPRGPWRQWDFQSKRLERSCKQPSAAWQWLLAGSMSVERSKRTVKPPKKFEEIEGGSQATTACLNRARLMLVTGGVPRSYLSLFHGI